MKSKEKSGKREVILNAMLDVVVERGFHEAPMSLISERSGASAGIIYHYFKSKEEIIGELYGRVRDMKRTRLLDGYTPEMKAKDAVTHVWINAYNFYKQHQRDMRFLEQCEAAAVVVPLNKSVAPDPRQIDFERRFKGRSQGGVLADLPASVLHEITLGLAARLARQPGKLTRAEQSAVADRVWQFVGE